MKLQIAEGSWWPKLSVRQPPSKNSVSTTVQRLFNARRHDLELCDCLASRGSSDTAGLCFVKMSTSTRPQHSEERPAECGGGCLATPPCLYDVKYHVLSHDHSYCLSLELTEDPLLHASIREMPLQRASYTLKWQNLGLLSQV